MTKTFPTATLREDSMPVYMPRTVGIIEGSYSGYVYVNYLSGKLMTYRPIVHQNPLHGAPPAAAHPAITYHKITFRLRTLKLH